MGTDPWERTCKRCGRDFEVGLWCREVAYCDICKAELDAMSTESQDESVLKQKHWPQVDTPGEPETESDSQNKEKGNASRVQPFNRLQTPNGTSRPQ